MEIIQKLPDDIIMYIYTKILKKYRLHEGKLIKRINLEKYKFLEKFIYRKIVSVSNKNYGYNHELTKEIKYKLNNFWEFPDRKDLSIDDDMIWIFLNISENKVKYDIYQYKLKKSKPSIYHKGDYEDYDWEVFSYTYEL